MTESVLFQDLAILMAAAGLASVIFSKFNWPKVIGYIAVGMVLSEHTWGGGLLLDVASVKTIGQLGVVFLMFSMGLEFSTTDMRKMKSVTLPTALLDTILMMWLGYTVGTRVFGWEMVPSLFLGAAICDSATTMLAKMIDELGWRTRAFVGFTLGTSVCEDIVCVGIVALITGVAQGAGMKVGDVAMSMGGLGLFFVAVIVFGLVLVPRLLNNISRRHDDEVLLLFILGICFFVSFIAFRFQFSLALGAFLVGILGAASDVRVRINALMSPLKSMFSSIFFVSIGSLVDPAAFLACWPQILLLTFVVVFGKMINCTIGGLLTGEGVKTSVQMGMSLAQIGEFAFMVALIYISTTGDTSSPMYQIVVAVSLLTTLLNPLLIKASEPVSSWLDTRLPKRLHEMHRDYRAFLHKAEATSGGEIRTIVHIRNTIGALVVFALLNFIVAISGAMLDDIDWSRFSVFFEKHDQFFFTLAVNVFIVGMFAPVTKVAKILGANVARLIIGSGESKVGDVAVRQMVMFVIRAFVLMAFFAEMTMININMAPSGKIEVAILCILVLAIAVLGWRNFMRLGRSAAVHFNEALGADDRRKRLGEMMIVTVPRGTLHQLKLDVNSPAVGATVVTLNIRAKTGASIVSVHRGSEIIRHIGPDLEFRVGDVLLATGTSSQIAALKDLLGIVA
ncbi:MAG: cation:proton antiporter [Kiritimatiellae bacterium]|nr:cation:proton antiporter [Kiritimatiellia bacterium]